MYLYVEKKEGLEPVPEDLLRRFGKPELAMTLMLSPEKKLARADIEHVLEKIEEQGFYLQMPPRPDLDVEEPLIQELCNKNSKLF